MDSGFSRESARLSFARLRPIRAAKSCISMVEEKLGLYPEVSPARRRIQVVLTGLTAYGTFKQISDLCLRDIPEGAAYTFGALAMMTVLYAFSRGVGESFRNANAVGPRFEMQNGKIAKSKYLYALQEIELQKLESGSAEISPDEILRVASLDPEISKAQLSYCQRAVHFFKEQVWFAEGTSGCQKFLQASGVTLSAWMGYSGTNKLATHLVGQVVTHALGVAWIGHIVGGISAILAASTARCVLVNNDVYRNSTEKRAKQLKRVEKLEADCDDHEKRLRTLESEAGIGQSVVKIDDLPVQKEVEQSSVNNISCCTRYIKEKLKGLSQPVLDKIEHHIYPGLSWPDRLAQSSCTMLYAYLGYIVPHDDLQQLGYDQLAIIVGSLAIPITLINCYKVVSFNFQQAKEVAKQGQMLADVIEDGELQAQRIKNLKQHRQLSEQKNIPDEQKSPTVPVAIEENDEAPGATRSWNICNWGICSGFKRKVSTLQRMMSQQQAVPVNDTEMTQFKRAPT